MLCAVHDDDSHGESSHERYTRWVALNSRTTECPAANPRRVTIPQSRTQSADCIGLVPQLAPALRPFPSGKRKTRRLGRVFQITVPSAVGAAADSKRWLLVEGRSAPHARNQLRRLRYLQRTYARRCSDPCRRTGSWRMRSRRSVLDTAWRAQLDAQGSLGQFFGLRPCRHRPRNGSPKIAHFALTRSRNYWSPRRAVLWSGSSICTAAQAELGPHKSGRQRTRRTGFEQDGLPS
jgi:hypothetical protein